MMLDELLDALLKLKRDFPACGSATVYGEPCDAPHYDRGDVYLPVRCHREHIDYYEEPDVDDAVELVT